MAYGAEFRLDNYQIEAGEELSYSYGQPSQDIPGLPGKAAGAQVFPGFKPRNALDKSRNNKGLYADFEGEFGPRVLISVPDVMKTIVTLVLISPIKSRDA